MCLANPGLQQPIIGQPCIPGMQRVGAECLECRAVRSVPRNSESGVKAIGKIKSDAIVCLDKYIRFIHIKNRALLGASCLWAANRAWRACIRARSSAEEQSWDMRTDEGLLDGDDGPISRPFENETCRDTAEACLPP